MLDYVYFGGREVGLHTYWAHGTVGMSHVFKSSIEEVGLAFTRVGGLRETVQANVFFPLPTPVIVNNNRARLLRVFVLYELERETALGPIFVYDGQNGIETCDAHSDGIRTFEYIIGGPTSHTGVHRMDDLIDNRTRFNFERPPLVFFGLTLVITLAMGPKGKARFTAVGADYEIP